MPVSNQYVQAIFALKSGKGLDYISYHPQWATDLPRELSLQLVGARELQVRLRDELTKSAYEGRADFPGQV